MRLQFSCIFITATALLSAQTKPRARDLGVPFEGTPGALNAITDIAGIEVGHTTLIEGDSVRTGVTAVWPRGKASNAPAFGGWFSLNGNGEMTGATWVEESGLVDGPILITNTHSVGVVRDAFIGWQVNRKRTPGSNTVNGDFWSLPIVAETYDGVLNDINGFHVRPEHVVRAIEAARTGAVPEGNVGGGTGMICFGFKGGIGTASRIVNKYHVAALVQCNCGARNQLHIAGVPVGLEIPAGPATARSSWNQSEERGSIIIVIATDAPLLPHQTKRLARRASLALGRLGSISGNGSGDIFIAFSTANANAGASGAEPMAVTMLSNEALGPVFAATVQATEEAIVNAMVSAEDMTGFAGHTVRALPHDRLKAALKKYGRLQ